MKKLLCYLKDYKKETVLGPLFKLLEASFELFVPLVMAAIIDVGIVNQDLPYILKMGGVLVILAFIGFVCAVFAQFFAAKAAVGFAANVRKAIFDNIQKRTYSQMDSFGTSTMINRLTADVNQVQTGVNLVLRLFLRSPFIVFGAMIMAFTVDVKGALIFVVTIPLLAVVVFTILLVSIPLYKKVQNALDAVVTKTRENLTGIRVIRAFSMEEKEVADYDDKVAVYKHLQLFAGRVGAFMNPVTFTIVNVATLFILWQGAGQVDTGVLTQGELIALVNYMAQILVELIKLANLIITVTRSLAGADRIADMLEEKVGEENGGEAVEGVKEITFRNVSFRYKNAGADALQNLSFTVKKGDIVGIIGGTGSGKTTLVNLAAGFYQATDGEVLVNGKALCDKDLATYREHFSMVPQTAVLFSGTIKENLQWGKENATEEEMWHALTLADAAEFTQKKEKGLDSEVLQGGKNFSGGQRQRLSMARSFIKDADVFVLDDSTSALDYATEARVRQGIRKLSEDSICFIVSQRAASIMDADLILVLDNGELVGKGVHKELLADCSVYREIYSSQFPLEEEVQHA
ncbi:MAG: ABC transporter ATP-binding protein [Lachnospiraceae bacterium]|nr:ABC transporter ATP-binding protein [Lachnospiraceae bacterium]